ncbi:MAG: hypothetical protein ACE3JK_11615 [Sporolactobacillus sp.]
MTFRLSKGWVYELLEEEQQKGALVQAFLKPFDSLLADEPASFFIRGN